MDVTRVNFYRNCICVAGCRKKPFVTACLVFDERFRLPPRVHALYSKQTSSLSYLVLVEQMKNYDVLS